MKTYFELVRKTREIGASILIYYFAKKRNLHNLKNNKKHRNIFKKYVDTKIKT